VPYRSVPGYKALPNEFSGLAAEHVRYAEVLQRAGDVEEAVRLLETTLEVCATARPELPGWLCGRLAALYRTLKRYDDEVLLLERYRESQSSEEARSRFDARLSKARAIADRNQHTDTNVLASVRRVINRAGDDAFPPKPIPAGDDTAFTAETLHGLRAALAACTGDRWDTSELSGALARLSEEARTHAHPPERIVAVLREIWRGTEPPEGAKSKQWDDCYRWAITRSLALYFDDPIK
jgi:hypothetical protein